MTGALVAPEDPASGRRCADAQAPGAPGPRRARRRIWQLPPQAHEILLGMAFPPEALRREAARRLGQLHHRPCVLHGSDVDVLYSVVHDMVRRNPLSEAFQKRLDTLHAPTLRRWNAWREVEALQAAWSQALSNDTLPAALWALLTHPLGETLETAALYDARGWVFAHGRRSVALNQAGQAAQARSCEDRQRLDALQARLEAQRLQAERRQQEDQAEIARLRGELARLRAVVPQPPAVFAQARPAAGPAPVIGIRPVARPVVRLPAETLQAPGPMPPEGPRVPMGEAPSNRVDVQGRRVLCVGGIQHAVARYRGRVEQRGGRFEHHDGGLEDSVHALDARLGRADVVICQTGCINHEAYHRVKRHCDRTGTPCVYLDRPSLSRFEQALAPPMSPAASQASA